jgi:hypothetical protein
MLCKFCSGIDFDQVLGPEGYKHHANYADLSTSAENGCEACIMIREGHARQLEGPEEFADVWTKDLDRCESQTQITIRPYPRDEDDVVESHVVVLVCQWQRHLAKTKPYLWSYLEVSTGAGMCQLTLLKLCPEWLLRLDQMIQCVH